MAALVSDALVIDSEGQQARLASPVSDEAGQAVLVLDTGDSLSVPADLLDLRDDGSYTLAVAFSALREGTEVVMPIIEERLTVGKRVRETGRVRLQKLVETRQETVDEPLLREEVEVERVPVGEFVDGPVAVRHEGDVLIVPVLEEVLVVETRLRLREELRVTRRRTEVHEPQEITLRSERIEIERLAPDPAAPAGPATEPETGESSRL